VKLQSSRRRAVIVIPIRIGLGIVWLVAAAVGGAGTGPSLLAFAVGAIGGTISVLADPRARLVHGPVEPLPYPADAVLESPLRHAWSAMLPSTLGVSVLAAIALGPSPVLAALLGGISAGLGIATVIALPAIFAGDERFLDYQGRIYTRT
jgi:hypothetical protein